MYLDHLCKCFVFFYPLNNYKNSTSHELAFYFLKEKKIYKKNSNKFQAKKIFKKQQNFSKEKFLNAKKVIKVEIHIQDGCKKPFKISDNFLKRKT